MKHSIGIGGHYVQMQAKFLLLGMLCQLNAAAAPEKVAHTTGLRMLWESADKNGLVGNQATNVLAEVNDLCKMHPELAPTPVDLPTKNLLELIKDWLGWGDYTAELDYVENAVKHVLASALHQHTRFWHIRDLVWYPVEFYGRYCAKRCGIETATERMLNIVDYFPAGSKYFRQRAAWGYWLTLYQTM